MEHFICTGGCGGISGTPGVCHMESCPRHGKSFESCSCNDGEHGDAKAKAELDALRETEEGYEDTNKDEA